MLIKKRALVLDGFFVLWAGLFSSCECLLVHLRNIENFMNHVSARFFTGGM